MPDNALKPYFNILRTVVLTSRHEMDPDMMVEASLKLDVHGNVEHTAAGGFGPVHALDRALRRALTRWYPELEQMHLIDYKVRVLSPPGRTFRRRRMKTAPAPMSACLLSPRTASPPGPPWAFPTTLLRPAWKPWRTPSRTSSTRRSRPDGVRNAEVRRSFPGDVGAPHGFSFFFPFLCEGRAGS